MIKDLLAENKRLSNENQSQQRTITQLKSSLDEAKISQDNTSVLIKNQLRDATSSLAVLKKEKIISKTWKSWYIVVAPATG